MTRCIKCGRTLKRPPVHGMGPVCARAVLGAKPARPRILDRQVKRDELTPDLFAEVRP